MSPMPLDHANHTNGGDTAFFTTGNAADYAPTPKGATPPVELPPRAPPTGIDVLVVGGGTAGLATALECWRKGHTVRRVLERAPGPVFTGDTLVVQLSAQRVFRHWPGVRADLERDGIDADMSYHRHTGEHIYGPVKPPSPGADEPNMPKPSLAQNRVRFTKTLLRHVAAVGIPIEWGAKAVDFFEDDEQGKAGVTCEGGRVYVADLVVAADGMRTVSNRLISGEHDKPQPSGWSVYRTAYPLDIAMRDPQVAARWSIEGREKDRFEFWLGNGMHLVVIVSRVQLSWTITHRDDDAASSAGETWTPDVTPEQVLAFLDAQAPDWHDDIKALIRTAPPRTIIHWRLNWRDLRRQWTSPGGRVVQVGDAAHAFLPTSGNGATQGIEDATVLASCLQLAGTPARAGLGARIANALRVDRVACLQKAMFVNSQTKAKTDWDAVARDPSLVHGTGNGNLNSWTFMHDAEAYAYAKYGEALHELVNGGPALRNTNYPPGHTLRAWSIAQVKEDLAAGRKMMDLLDGDWS